MEWLSLSELVVGQAIKGKLSAHAIDPEQVHPPYGQVVLLLRDGANDSDLIEKVGFGPYNACINAATVADDAPVDAIALMEKAALRAEMGHRLEPIIKKLKTGEEADIGKILSTLQGYDLGYNGLTPLSKVEPLEGIWIPSYYDPLDKEVGGLPLAGMVLVGGPPGTGKTTFLCRLLINAAKAGKKSAFFSMEMTLAGVLYRMLEMGKLTKKERALILGSERDYVVEELYAEAARAVAMNPDLYFIGIDFADMMIEGEETTSKASHIYRVLAKLSRNTGVPVVLLSQLSGSYVGGEPQIHHFRWSRLAEAMASLILLLYNPDRVYADMESKRSNKLQRVPGGAYIIVGKSRWKFAHPSVGAFLVDWKGGIGWGSESRGWFER